MQISRAWPLFFLAFFAFAPAAMAKKPADKFKGKIILSTKPFPTKFKNDRAFIKHMKKVDTKGFRYHGKDYFNVEFMAFFARPYGSTAFTATIYDMTEGRRLVTSFEVYPGQRNTRILASGTSFDKETFPVERKYLMVVSATYGGPVIAETTFAIKEEPGVKKQVAKPQVHEF